MKKLFFSISIILLSQIFSNQFLNRFTNKIDNRQLNTHNNLVRNETELLNFIESIVITNAIPGLSISVVENENIVWDKHFGYGNIENNILVNENTMYILSSISKTINVPTECDYEEFKDIYLYAAEKGLKGCTTFRFNPEAFQGVLVKESDLENTTYSFTLEDGSTVEFKGNEEVEYDGEIHTAANLFDALKEGYYGKF